MAIGGWEHAMRRAADDSLQTLKVNWHLGFTSFGGPPVHFKIVCKSIYPLTFRWRRRTNETQFHDKFVNKLKWIDEQIVSAFAT